MNPPNSPELRALRELFHTCDPAPSGVIDAAYAAAGHARRPAARIVLELVGDSADEPAPAQVRAARVRESRVLTFMMPGNLLEMDLVTTTPGLVRASGIVISRSGQATPDGDLVLRHPDGQCTGRLDRHGAFDIQDVPRGPVCVTFHPASSTPAVADWFVC